MEIWELTAREEIRDLVARYAHHADRGRFDDLVALFAPDGSLRVDERDALCGRDAIRTFLGATRTSLRDSRQPRAIRHHVTTLRIDVASPDEASGAAYFLVVTDRLDHWGRYRDRYVRHDGRWLFGERRVRVDGFAPDSWAAARRRELSD